jgi:class 3 adenylate cyclase
MASRPTPEEFSSARLVIVVTDLTGYTRHSRTHPDEVMAQFLDRFYCLAEDAVSGGGGRVVKFMGDAMLAVFPPEVAAQAVAAVITLQVQSEKLASSYGFDMTLGANLHLGSAVIAELGKGASRRTDVIGRAVNQTFLLGAMGGIRLSEPLYRQLPSGERGPWEKHKAPAVYVLGEAGEPYDTLRKSAVANMMRW